MDAKTSNLITILIAVVAFISPMITKIIDVISNYLVHKSDLSEKHKSEIYKEYIRQAMAMIVTEETYQAHEYQSSYAEALLYAPKNVHDKMDQLDQLISTKQYKNATQLLYDISKHLNKS